MLVVAVVPISKPNHLLPEVDLHRCVGNGISYVPLSSHARCGTECFFQVKPPREDATCPFCNKQHFQVVNLGPKSDQEVQAEQMVRCIRIIAGCILADFLDDAGGAKDYRGANSS